MKNNLQATFRFDEHTGDITGFDIKAPTEALQRLVESVVTKMLQPAMMDRVRCLVGVIRRTC